MSSPNLLRAQFIARRARPHQVRRSRCTDDRQIARRRGSRSNAHVLGLAVSIWAVAASAHAAALAIVMAIDVSASVTADSYILQRDGIAHAFEDPRLIEAISGLPDGIEALVLEWSDPDSVAVTVGWTRVTDRRGATAFAAAVHAATRSSRGLTAIGSALAAAATQFDRLPQPATR